MVMGKYYLISKISNISYSKYKGSAIRLSKQCPAAVDEVILGLKDNSNVKKKITTFKDKDGNIFERAFDYSGEPLKNRQYKSILNKTDKNSDCFCSSQIKEFSLPRKFLRKFLNHLKGKKLDFWTPVKIETHHIKQSAKTNEIIHSMTRITDIAKGQIPTHTIVEFPHKKISDNKFTAKKYLQYKVNPQDYTVIGDSFLSENVKIPQKDNYLGFRVLDIDDFQRPVTRRFIKERGLADMNIKVRACHYKEKKGQIIAARFTPWNGAVEYNKIFRHKSKSALVDTARHEVEHAWQYYLNARNGCYLGDWEISMYKKFGDIYTSPHLREEANLYSESIGSYVSSEKNPKKYFDLLIEVLARKAGNKEKVKYDNEGTEIRTAFPNIPNELL